MKVCQISSGSQPDRHEEDNANWPRRMSDRKGRSDMGRTDLGLWVLGTENQRPDPCYSRRKSKQRTGSFISVFSIGENDGGEPLKPGKNERI